TGNRGARPPSFLGPRAPGGDRRAPCRRRCSAADCFPAEIAPDGPSSRDSCLSGPCALTRSHLTMTAAISTPGDYHSVPLRRGVDSPAWNRTDDDLLSTTATASG